MKSQYTIQQAKQFVSEGSCNMGGFGQILITINRANGEFTFKNLATRRVISEKTAAKFFKVSR